MPVPPASLPFMGEAEQGYVEIGSALARQLYEHGLGADGRLLDVGSGYGRLAAGLLATGYEGRYLGFDILPRHVAWCQRRLGRRPGYRFRHLDVHNARYNPRGTIASTETRFPAKSGSKTFCAARRLVAEAGLRIVLVRRGSWAGDEPAGEFQDLVLLEKPLPPPPPLLVRARRRLRRSLRRR